MDERDPSSTGSSRIRYSQRQIIKGRLFALLKCKTSNQNEFGPIAPMTREEESLDWLYITIITLVVGCLDKVFDLIFILELAQQSEWVFFALSLFFTITSTIVASLFAAQSFWVQSSAIPGWSNAWVEEVPKKRKAFLEKHLYRPLNERIVPHASQFKVKKSVQHNSESIEKSLGETDQISIFTITREQNLSKDKDRSKVHSKKRHKLLSEPPVAGDLASCEVNEVIEVSESAYSTISSISLDLEPSNISEAPAIQTSIEDFASVANKEVALEDHVDEVKEASEKQFRPWVRYLLIFLFCTGLLPEWVLMVNLSMYAGGREDRRVISCLLRDTWYVQTLKLSEALLESIPQIHLKVFYFLTQHHGALPPGQILGVVISGISIAVGLIEPYHVQIGYKAIGFILILINLGTRIFVSAALNQATTDGVYFAPFACALVVSAGATAAVTLVRKGNYRQGEHRFDKYVTVPVLRTFCTPPADRLGVLVALVFLAAAAVFCGFYTGEDAAMAASLVVAAALVGQGITGLFWYVVGISQINAENKKWRKREFIQQHSNEPSVPQRY